MQWWRTADTLISAMGTKRGEQLSLGLMQATSLIHDAQDVGCGLTSSGGVLGQPWKMQTISHFADRQCMALASGIIAW